VVPQVFLDSWLRCEGFVQFQSRLFTTIEVRTRLRHGPRYGSSQRVEARSMRAFNGRVCQAVFLKSPLDLSRQHSRMGTGMILRYLPLDVRQVQWFSRCRVFAVAAFRSWDAPKRP
jgi:hypothetical protein